MTQPRARGPGSRGAAGRWFDEKLYPDVRQSFAIARVIYRRKTDHQVLIIFETPVYGRVLALDGVIQVTERDEHIYHEMMVHTPILAHGRARRVLIIGGGDGGALRECLRHRAIDSVTLVEIDRAVIDLCRKYMPSIPAKAFDDRRARVTIADGARFVRETQETFDVVIVDSTDPVGPGAVLFSAAFYRACKRCLKPGGILVNQNGVPFLQPGELSVTLRRRRGYFRDVGFYLAAVPSYYGGFMALGWASDHPAARHTRLATLKRRFAAARLKTRYYTPEIHAASFALPASIRDVAR